MTATGQTEIQKRIDSSLSLISQNTTDAISEKDNDTTALHQAKEKWKIVFRVYIGNIKHLLK